MGIGTATPSSKLDVNGGVNASASVSTPLLFNQNVLTVQSGTSNIVLTPATGYGIGIGKTPTFGRELDVNGEIYQNNNQVLDDVLGGGGIAVSGSANSRTVSLSNSGATAGTFPKVIVDTYGRVTYGYGSLLATDIPNLDTGKLTTGTLPILRGGTNSTATPTAGTVVYGNGTAQAYTTAGTAGQILGI